MHRGPKGLLCLLACSPLFWLVRKDFGHHSAPSVTQEPDCYFDKECHSLVDWDKIKVMKMKFFDRLKEFKEEKTPEKLKADWVRMHRGFAAAGVPEDRIDYILTKWVESNYPEALEVDHSSIRISGFACSSGYGSEFNQEYSFQGRTKDGRPYYRGTTQPDKYIYYDSYCADDTPGPRWLLGSEPDINRLKGLNTHDGDGCNNEFSIVTNSMHLPGGTQQTAWQWCGDHGHHEDRTVTVIYENNLEDSSDRLREPEEALKGRGKAKGKGEGEGEGKAMETMTEQKEASKTACVNRYAAWGEAAAAKSCTACQKWFPKNVDVCMDCGSLCYKEVCKKDEDGFECAKRSEFKKCDMKCLKVDRKTKKIFAKLSEKDEEVPKGACSKYASWGPGALKGCANCAKSMPTKIDMCMECGATCYKKVCKMGEDGFECAKRPEFMTCDNKCLEKSAQKEDFKIQPKTDPLVV